MQLVLPSVATLGDHMASFDWLLRNQLLLFEELSRGDTCGRMLGILLAVSGSRPAAGEGVPFSVAGGAYLQGEVLFQRGRFC